jgi:hypothetical protein
MVTENPYYKLDVRYIGTQNKTAAQEKKDREMTTQWIEAMRAGKPNPVAKKKKAKAKKAK